ncbi:MAG: hypothetical protein ACFFDN_52075, partial [Candidatus Hodarchaeota archaeon]
MKNIESAIENLAHKWLGKENVVNISEEEINGELYIIFWVNSPEVDSTIYPKKIDGYEIIVRPSGKIIAL